MRNRLAPHSDDDRDPREQQGAQIIDLATRSVLPAVSQRGRSDSLGLAGGIAVVGLLGAATLWSLSQSRQEREAFQEATRKAATGTSAPAVAVAVPAQAITPVPVPAPQPAAQAATPQRAPAFVPAGNPHAGPTVLYDAGNAMGVSGVSGYVPPASGTGNSNDDFASRLGGVGGGAAVAGPGINPATTVAQGTLIPAVLETAIDTDVPGFVRAVVSSDVRSFDGSKVLVPRSSRLIGQYKSGMQAGQKRAYVIWTRLIRPDGVTVNIASPAIGFGGETGLAGKVDDRFFERFGSAMLLSVIGGLSAISSGGASVVIAGGGQSAAAAAVGQTGQIGPTIRVRQGEPVRVFTARDLDFSAVATP